MACTHAPIVQVEYSAQVLYRSVKPPFTQSSWSKGIYEMNSKQQSQWSNCMHRPVMSWDNACTLQADAWTYCMGSKVSSLYRAYLYSSYFAFICQPRALMLISYFNLLFRPEPSPTFSSSTIGGPSSTPSSPSCSPLVSLPFSAATREPGWACYARWRYHKTFFYLTLVRR